MQQLSFENPEEIKRRGMELLKRKKVPKRALQLGEKYRSQIESGYTPKLCVKWISEQIGYGAFAEEKIGKNSYVGEYVGIVRENVRVYFAPLNNYCYEYPVPDHLGRNYVIDATKGNICRFINHSNQPNLKPYYAFFDGFFHLIFIALRKIEKQEQLTYDYGPSYWYVRTPPEVL